jgi:hypothetical protein
MTLRSGSKKSILTLRAMYWSVLRLEGYRSRVLSEEQIRRLLRFESRFEVQALLKERGVSLNYTLEDLEADRERHRRLGL